MVHQNDRAPGPANADATPGPQATAETGRPEVMAAVAGTVRALRHRRGLSADQLAARAGVSKGALVALENATANPNLATLVRIADALGVPVSVLLEQDRPRRVLIADAAAAEPLWRGSGGGSARLLLTTPTEAPVEVWRWQLGPGEAYASHPHPAGVVETVTVTEGAAVVTVDGTGYPLGQGVTAAFAADVSHAYQGGPDGTGLLMTVHLPADPKGPTAP